MKPFAYTYNAEIYCPDCILEQLDYDAERFASLTVEEALDVLAEEQGVDRLDEWSFDSGEFPKPCFFNEMWFDEEENSWKRHVCGGCHEELLGNL